jgi:hypothetical protein
MIEILRARRYVTGQIEAVAHLDNTKFVDDAAGDPVPDPAWVLSNSWHVSQETWAGWTPAERDAWITSMQQEFAQMCREQRVIVDDAEDGGTVLPIEGSTFAP